MNVRKEFLGQLGWVISGIAWATGIVVGLVVLFRYQSTAGAVGKQVMKWPAESRIVWDGDHANLIMVAHPHCPCTRASLDSLARIMAHCHERTKATVLFVKPPGAPSGWEQTDLWRNAAAIPWVHVLCDDEGLEATRFGVRSSGHVLLFERNGQRLFSGGITSGRGHQGDNAGLDQCIAILNGETHEHHDAPVYGCSLLEPRF